MHTTMDYYRRGTTRVDRKRTFVVHYLLPATCELGVDIGGYVLSFIVLAGRVVRVFDAHVHGQAEQDSLQAGKIGAGGGYSYGLWYAIELIGPSFPACLYYRCSSTIPAVP
jgi:hypothetical protein